MAARIKDDVDIYPFHQPGNERGIVYSQPERVTTSGSSSRLSASLRGRFPTPLPALSSI